MFSTLGGKLSLSELQKLFQEASFSFNLHHAHGFSVDKKSGDEEHSARRIYKKSFKYIEVKDIRLDLKFLLLKLKQAGTGLHEQLRANSTFLLK